MLGVVMPEKNCPDFLELVFRYVPIQSLTIDNKKLLVLLGLPGNIFANG